jgi:acetyl-CoA/propionyl-CoA carboxylase biotin carboxyl carrier protein
MKMEHTIRAPFDGQVTDLPVVVGQKVALNQAVATIHADDVERRSDGLLFVR